MDPKLKEYRKLVRKHIKFEVDKSLVRKWGKQFWCPAFHQWTELALCNRRRFMAEDHVCYQACIKCPIRRHSFRRLRKPTLRTPTMDE